MSYVTPVLAQDMQPPIQEFKKAQVIKILEEGEKEIFENKHPYQIIEVKILEGTETGKIEQIEHGTQTKLIEDQKVKNNDLIVIYRSNFQGKTEPYQIIDKYRLDTLINLILGFFVLVLVISRLKGLGSILGLFISFLVIIKFIVPRILNGADPVLTTIFGCSFIILGSIYLAHGFSKQTSIAIFSTIISLTVTGFLASFFIQAAKLTGLGNEVAYGLTFGPTTAFLNFKGLLLGGVIIGTLGVLDDVTTTQSATIFELSKANKTLKFWELVKRGMVVGKEHISSLVNTLVLAYTGASLPLFIALILNPSGYPTWFILNNEPIAEEIVRTIGGSVGLVLAVPITTLIASYFASRNKI